MGETEEHATLDLSKGVPASALTDGAMILGRVGDEVVFWSQHYDVAINYVGEAERWDEVVIDGSLEAVDCSVKYRRDGRTLACATVGRDRANLDVKVELERD